MKAGKQHRPGDADRGEATTAPPGTVRDQQPAPMGYDAELGLHNQVLRRACRVAPADHVLDVGCGTGQTTRYAARQAVAGSALGIDVSAPAIARARELARTEDLRNVAFECADAQVHPFPQHRFDMVISRFGTMFFDDPVVAFTNVGRALRPAGRLVMMVWQAHERNEWDVAIQQSLAGPDGTVPVDSAAPDPFSLADPTSVTGILVAAGFGDLTFVDVQQPVYYGPDVDTALDWVRGFTSTTQALRRLDPPAAAHALDRLRQALAEHLTAEGVWFDSRAWIVTAIRQPG